MDFLGTAASGTAGRLLLALVCLSPLVLIWVRARAWPGPTRRAFRLALGVAVVCAAGGALTWAGGGGSRLLCWLLLGSVVPLALAGAAVARADDRARLLSEQQLDRFRVLDAALGASRDGVLVTASRAGAVGLQIVYANPAFEELTGYGTDEAIGQSPSLLYADSPAPDRELVQAALRSGTPGRIEVQARRKDGTRVWVEWDIVPVPDARDGATYRVAVLRDTTERRRLEEQLRNAARLEGIGRLAAGVAHDFNNLLTVVNGNAALLGDLISPGSPAARLVDEVRFAADRAGWLVRQLLTFGRPRPAAREPLDLGQVVSDMAPIVQRLLGPGVAAEFDAAPGCAVVEADRGELEQVVMNLAVNARDAMPDGGRLAVRVRLLSPAGPARLEVSDTGCGMPPAVQARMFEPFFTTKGEDKGTGLGLATVQQVVQRCGGTVAVESALGRGTTFRIDLPARAGQAPQAPTAAAPAPAPEPRGAAVLLVEDESGLRVLARRILEGRGYRVTEAADGTAALAVLDSGYAFDLLVTDIRMPGADGGQVADRARASRPHIGVVLMSGYTDKRPDVPGAVFLPKPFAPAALIRAAERVLTAPTPAG